MIPILMSGDFVRGFLPDALSCIVTEERNGIFEMELTYPVSGPMFDKLMINRFIKAKSNDTSELQLFRIYEITKPINGVVTVKCEHVSYALASYPVSNVSVSGTAHQAISAVLAKASTYLSELNRFQSYETGMTASKTFTFQVGSARAALGGSEGSVLDVYGGEYEWDNYHVKLHEHRGSDTGVVIAYRKNMTDLKVTTSLESAYTALFPYAIKDKALVTISGGKIAVTNHSGIAERILIRDFSGDFGSEETVNASTLRAKAQAFLDANDINTPGVSVSVSFIHLWQSPEYADLAALENVSLCDWVTVRHDGLGFDKKVQVIKTVYDCIAERYVNLELGSARSNFTNTLRKSVTDVKKLLDNLDLDVDTDAITAGYNQAIAAATAQIRGISGGYVHFLPSGSAPQEIVISNIENYTSNSAKVWRWNKNGLGHSSTGYNGTYGDAAITADGMINGKYIIAGSISASVITGGILQSSDASTYFDLNNDFLRVGDSDLYCKLRNGALTQHVTSSNALIGGLTSIVPGASGKTAEVLFYDENQLGVRISKLFYDSKDKCQKFDPIAYFDTSNVTINANYFSVFSYSDPVAYFDKTLVKMYANRFAFYSGNARAYITIESSLNKIEFHDGVNYRTLDGICSDINGKADAVHSHESDNWFTTALDNKADAAHDHEYDSWFTDHNHDDKYLEKAWYSQTTEGGYAYDYNLIWTAINGKAASTHNHTSDSWFTTALAGKAASTHNHTSDSWFTTALAGKAASTHNHTSDSWFTTALAGKSNEGHTHSEYAAANHIHSGYVTTNSFNTLSNEVTKNSSDIEDMKNDILWHRVGSFSITRWGQDNLNSFAVDTWQGCVRMFLYDTLQFRIGQFGNFSIYPTSNGGVILLEEDTDIILLNSNKEEISLRNFMGLS